MLLVLVRLAFKEQGSAVAQASRVMTAPKCLQFGRFLAAEPCPGVSLCPRASLPCVFAQS